MKTIATRRMDELGRVVIPKELRLKLAITEGEAFDIGCDKKGRIVLQPKGGACVLCGSRHDLFDVEHNCVCASCIATLIYTTGLKQQARKTNKYRVMVKTAQKPDET